MSTYNRKRKHAEAARPSIDPPSSQPAKRLKSSAKRPSTAFWESLSKVWCTRRALKELDRRTIHYNGPRKPVSASQQFDERDIPEQVKRFARHGGPELRDLRGYPVSKDADLSYRMSSNSSRRRNQTPSTRPTSFPITKPTKKSSAYDNNFEQLLMDNGIYMNNRKSKPSNLEEIRRRLAQARESSSPSCFSQSAFEEFQRNNEDVVFEGTVMGTLVPTIRGNTSIPHEENVSFRKLESITNSTTVDGQPDFYDGARPENINAKIRKDLGCFIIPSVHPRAPAAPNFFLEAKASDGGAGVAKRQACHDGALGARAMHELQSYGEEEPIYDNNAYTITSTYHSGTGTLRMYTIHLTRPTAPGRSAEYHMDLLEGYALDGSREQFLKGTIAFRNGRDLAKEWRDNFISAANAKADALSTEPSNLETPSHSHPSHSTETYPIDESETSADELALLPSTKSTASKKRSSRAPQKKPSKAPRYSSGASIGPRK